MSFPVDQQPKDVVVIAHTHCTPSRSVFSAVKNSHLKTQNGNLFAVERRQRRHRLSPIASGGTDRELAIEQIVSQGYWPASEAVHGEKVFRGEAKTKCKEDKNTRLTHITQPNTATRRASDIGHCSGKARQQMSSNIRHALLFYQLQQLSCYIFKRHMTILIDAFH